MRTLVRTMSRPKSALQNRKIQLKQKMQKNYLPKIFFSACLGAILIIAIIIFLFSKTVLAGSECRCAGETTGRPTTSLGACCWGCNRVTGSYQNVFWDGAEKPCDCILSESLVGTMEGADEGTAVTTNPEFRSSLNKCCESFGGKPVVWRGQNEFCACKCPGTNEFQSARTLGDCCNACGVSEGGNVLWNTNLLSPSHVSTTCQVNCECADGSKKISGQPSDCCIACSTYAEVKFNNADFDCGCRAGGRVFREVTTPDECCRTASRELRVNINDLEVKIQGVDLPCGPEMLRPAEAKTPPPPASPPVPRLQIPLPTLPQLTEFMPLTFVGEAPERYLIIPWIGQYIAAIYKYVVGVVGILAGIMIVIGGAIWLTAGGSAERVTLARSFIKNALTGLVIALTSYLLLYTINPDLVKFEAMKLKVIERIEFETAVNLASGGFDADVNPPPVNLTEIPGDSPAAKAAALCKPDPGNYAGRIANLKEILPQWLAICRNGCAYVKGGYTKECKSSGATSGRMLTPYFCILKANNRPLPPGCENIQTVENCKAGKNVDPRHSCGPALQQYYHDQWAVPICNTGMIIGDCLTFMNQLLNCAAKTKHPIPQYARSGLPASEYLVFEADGIDDALAKINAMGGLKFGDLIWSNSFGHNYMYTDGTITEMGGFSGSITIPGVGKASRVGVKDFNEYINIVRNQDKKARQTGQDIKTFIYRPYDF